ncbi:VapB antitoxin [Oleiphilus messinensis]|uniref:VapB antitoxin n=1 Tax=Oleiphilus messinensis TaxID=141451 RepID=A0A1Y0I7U1_9GAMM|nr:toxin-antitoxin system HicB family antitoxin [Oleiphilus messinensis]ARU56521.1 VapB antitoxin [Oleiphilus messinensis]
MATLTVRLPDDKHERLKALAMHKKISINKLMEELSTQALAEFDSEIRFRTLAASGSIERGLELLDKLDSSFKG